MGDTTRYSCGGGTDSLVHSTEEQRARLREHLVPMEGVPNLRDMGGYEMENGRRVKQGQLFRGGSLAEVDTVELRQFSERYRLVQIFDFRTEGEIRRAPDRMIEGLRYLWLPAIDPKTEKKGTSNLPAKAYTTLHQFLIDNASNPQIQQIARGMYEEMVTNEYTQLQYAAFLQTIITTSTGSVYWHCSQGKDRTGLAAAYLLSALGASRDVVMQDYQLSNVYYEQELAEVVDLIIANGGGDEEIKVAVTFLGANVEYFSRALDVIECRYGSMYDYLTGPLCLTDKDIDILRQRYLE